MVTLNSGRGSRSNIWIIEKENFTILIPKGYSYCRRKSSVGGPRFKVSSEGLSAEIDIPLLVTHPSTNQGRCCLTPANLVVGCNGMPIVNYSILVKLSVAIDVDSSRLHTWYQAHLITKVTLTKGMCATRKFSKNWCRLDYKADLNLNKFYPIVSPCRKSGTKIIFIAVNGKECCLDLIWPEVDMIPHNSIAYDAS